MTDWLEAAEIGEAVLIDLETGGEDVATHKAEIIKKTQTRVTVRVLDAVYPVMQFMLKSKTLYGFPAGFIWGDITPYNEADYLRYRSAGTHMLSANKLAAIPYKDWMKLPTSKLEMIEESVRQSLNRATLTQSEEYTSTTYLGEENQDEF